MDDGFIEKSVTEIKLLRVTVLAMYGHMTHNALHHPNNGEER